ncbi:hypothetical protein AB0I98_16920 [Streptomyces sp. NPDC050211]|uniref:hypothetical protein n=1 Tax=Streptomyces sp. NPDC050211 TaxID=3154932 RepID=UPI003424A607
MTGVAAYLTCVIATTAVMCCHHGEGTPPGAHPVARAVRRHRPAWARGPYRARQLARRTRQEPT